jgi:hypothetical protein
MQRRPRLVFGLNGDVPKISPTEEVAKQVAPARHHGRRVFLSPVHYHLPTEDLFVSQQ